MGPWESVSAAAGVGAAERAGAPVHRPMVMRSSPPLARWKCTPPRTISEQPRHVRALMRLRQPGEASMIQGVPYCCTIRPQSGDQGGGYPIEFPISRAACRTGRRSRTRSPTASTPCTAGPWRCAPRGIRSPHQVASGRHHPLANAAEALFKPISRGRALGCRNRV
jgi:hypothetical protein